MRLLGSSTETTSAPLLVRELTTADRDHVIAVFETLSDQDRFFRFFRPMPTYSSSILQLLTAMDGADHVAVGAFVGPTCVGVARYIRSTHRPSRAEVAVTVSAEMRGRGVARRMLGPLHQLAEKRGVEEFEIYVHPQNRVASRLFASLGFATRFEDGSVVGSCSVGRMSTQVEQALAA